MTPSLEDLAPYVSQTLGISPEALARACRPAHERDIPALLALRREIVPDMWWDDERVLRWRYFTRRTDSGEVPYWVCEKDGEVLAACGLEPVTLVVDGMPIPAVRTLDIMVRPALDGLGLGAYMNMVLFRRFPVVLVTGSNERSHSLLTRMFDHPADLQCWRLTFSARSVVDGNVGSGVLNTVVTWPIDVLLSARRSISRVQVPAGIVITEMTVFDSEVSALTRRCEVQGRVLVRRNDEYLNWRFVGNPRCEYRLFGAFADERLEGYIVTRLNMARPNPLRSAEIVDWLIAPGGSSASVLAGLVQMAADECRHDGAWSVTCAGVDSDLLQVMEGAGFWLRPLERLPFFFKASDPAMHSRLSAGSDWILTRGDFDVE